MLIPALVLALEPVGKSGKSMALALAGQERARQACRQVAPCSRSACAAAPWTPWCDLSRQGAAMLCGPPSGTREDQDTSSCLGGADTAFCSAPAGQRSQGEPGRGDKDASELPLTPFQPRLVTCGIPADGSPGNPFPSPRSGSGRRVAGPWKALFIVVLCPPLSAGSREAVPTLRTCPSPPAWRWKDVLRVAPRLLRPR